MALISWFLFQNQDVSVQIPFGNNVGWFFVTFSVRERRFYQLTQQQHSTNPRRATMWRKCVCVYFNSGTAARKVSLIWWRRAQWTTHRELNLLLMKLCSNTSRQNCSAVLLSLCLCLSGGFRPTPSQLWLLLHCEVWSPVWRRFTSNLSANIF